MAAIISVVSIAPSPCLPFVALLTASILVAAMSAQTPPTGCTTRELLLLSPCLPFISAPPNNLSDTVPSACCEAFSSAFNSSGRICLCYFLREPQILGFPLNSTKLVSLSWFCPLSRDYSEKYGSLESLCSGSQTLPPLQSSKIPGIQEPNSPARENTSSMSFPAPPAPSAIMPPSVPANKPPPPPPSSATANGSSATKDCISWFLPGLVIVLVHISIHL